MSLILMNKPCEYTGISQSYKAGKHRGIDLVNHKLYSKTPIVATADGVVVAASKGAWDWSYGNMVAIYHGNGNYTNHAHLSKIKVKVGQKVKAGDLLGYMGTTGRSTGIHLHFEVWDCHDSKGNVKPRNFNKHRVNPKPYLDAAGKGKRYKVVTKKDPLNVRKSPEPGSKIIGSIPKGTIVVGTTREGNYIYIPSEKGWSSKSYLQEQKV